MESSFFVGFSLCNFVIVNQKYITMKTEEWEERMEMFKKIMRRFDHIDDMLEHVIRHKQCFDGDTLLDTYDMCKLLNITKRTLARYRKKKLIKYYLIDRKTFYKASEVEQAMKQMGKL